MRDEGLFGVGTPRTVHNKRKEPAAQEESQRKPKILFFGDSNMFGQSHIADTKFKSDIRYRHRYPLFFKQDYDVIEAALCSRTTSVKSAYDPEWVQASKEKDRIFDGSFTLPFMLAIHDPDIVVLSLGTNDSRASNRFLSWLENDLTVPKDAIRTLKAAGINTCKKWNERNTNAEWNEKIEESITSLEKTSSEWWSNRIAQRAKDLRDLALQPSVEKVYVLSPPTIRLVHEKGGTASMEYDEMSVEICDNFKEAFENVFPQGHCDKTTLIHLSDVLRGVEGVNGVGKYGVGQDGVHITENAHIAIATELSKTDNITKSMPKIKDEEFTTHTHQTIPEIVCYGQKESLLGSIITTRFQNDVVLKENTHPINALLHFVPHVKCDLNASLGTFEDHFHAVFSQHSASWLFLLMMGSNDVSLGLLAQAIDMVNEHPRHRHVAEGYNTNKSPEDTHTGLNVCLCMNEQLNLEEVRKHFAYGTFEITQNKSSFNIKRKGETLTHSVYSTISNLPITTKKTPPLAPKRTKVTPYK